MSVKPLWQKEVYLHKYSDLCSGGIQECGICYQFDSNRLSLIDIS